MTDLGPESPDVGIVAIRLSRPRAASRPALADAAGDRPIAAVGNAIAPNSAQQRAPQARIKIFAVGFHSQRDVQQAAQRDTDDKATRLP